MVIQTNINSLVGLSTSRKINFNIRNSLEKLSSGYRINKAADDPSGLAIASGMTAQIGGINMATQNAQDGMNLIQTADAAIAEMMAMAQRMRDLCVRGANEATLTFSDERKLALEYHTLWCELSREANAITFNTKKLFIGEFDITSIVGIDFVPVGQDLQIGPDASAQYQIGVYIPTFSTPITYRTSMGMFGPLDFQVEIANHDNDPDSYITAGTMSMAVYEAQQGILMTGAMIDWMANIRSDLGVQQRRLDHIINDIDAAGINISGARSRIMDVNMAAEISEFTKMQILQQSTTAILAQANAQPQSVLQLLQ